MVLVAYTKNEPQTLTTFIENRMFKNGAYQSVQSTPKTASFYAGGRFLSGYKNPDWRNQVKAGSNATTPLTASEVTYSDYKPATAVAYDYQTPSAKWDQYLTVGNFISEDTYDGTLLSTVDNLARTKAIQQLSSDFKGLTFLGELREAIHMVRHPAAGLRKGIDEFMRVSRKIRDRTQRTRAGLAAYKRAVGETWLEYHFGWAPLIGDVQDGFDVLNDRVSRPEYEPFKVSVSRDIQTPMRRVLTSGLQYVSWDVYRTSIQQCSAYYQGTAKVSCTASGMPERLGLYPSEFVPTAWELCPWSFLIDYFANIGDVLDCWATIQRSTFGYVSAGTRKLVTTKLEVRPRISSPNIANLGLSSSDVGSVVVSRKNVVRTNLTTIPLPQFGLKTKLSDSKLLNIAALLAAKRSDSQFRAR